MPAGEVSRKRVLSVFAVLAAVALLAAGGYLAYRHVSSNPQLIDQTVADLGLAGMLERDESLAASGFLEAERVQISSELSGRIVALHIAEGQEVTAQQPLWDLDDGHIRAQIAVADADISLAQAQLDLLEAGAQPQEIAHGEALLAQAETQAQVAKQAWEDARFVRDNPQALELSIADAQAAVTQARHEAKAARLGAEANDLQRDFWGRVTQRLDEGFDVPMPDGSTYHVSVPAERAEANSQWNLSSQQCWEAWQAAYAAEDQVEAATIALADLEEQRAQSLALDMQVNQAEAAYRKALAAVDQATATLTSIKSGATEDEIDAARKTVEQARVAQAAATFPLAKTHIRAPRDGLVAAVMVHSGEVVMAGVPLLELIDLGEVHLTVYIPEPDMGRVRLGQTVHVSVDSFPGRQFRGVVTYLADEAEFTPRNVQTREERIDTVFAVEITLPNPDQVLKPGMPADAVFVDSSGEP